VAGRKVYTGMCAGSLLDVIAANYTMRLNTGVNDSGTRTSIFSLR